MGNSGGSYYSTPENAMRAFDKLPRTVRNALANAIFDWASQPFLTQWRRGTSPKKLVALIREWDREACAKRERKRQSRSKED